MHKRDLAREIIKGLELAFGKLPDESADLVVEILMENDTPKVSICPVCSGTRRDPAYKYIPVVCPYCEGAGCCEYRDGTAKCVSCMGTGRKR